MKKSKMFLAAALAAVTAMSLSAQAQEDLDSEEVSSDVNTPPSGPVGMGPMGYGMGGGPGQMVGPGQRGGGPAMKQGKGFKKPGAGRMNAGRGWGIPDELEAKILQVIKKNDPAFADKLARLKESDERKYDSTIEIAARFLNMGRIANEPGIEKDIVRGISLEYEARELALKYENAKENEKAKIKEDMKGKLNELFDIRTKAHEIRVKRLENEISQLKRNLEARKANKTKIVEQRLDQLIGNKYLSW